MLIAFIWGILSFILCFIKQYLTSVFRQTLNQYYNIDSHNILLKIIEHLTRPLRRKRGKNLHEKYSRLIEAIYRFATLSSRQKINTVYLWLNVTINADLNGRFKNIFEKKSNYALLRGMIFDRKLLFIYLKISGCISA